MGLRRLLVAILTLILAACSSAGNIPSTQEPQQLAVTIVAMTFAAATRSAQAQPPALPTFPPAAPTLDKPRLYVNADVQCRTGIQSNFKVVASLTAGMVVDMVGKDTAASAWLVRVPNGADTCWVPAQNSSPSGSFQSLPEVTPQPSTLALPLPPVNYNWPYICSFDQGVLYKVTVNLSWSETSTDVNGFRVYRGDTQIADLPSNVTSLSDTAEVSLGADLVYGFEAYNDAGASPRHNLTITSVCKGKP